MLAAKQFGSDELLNCLLAFLSFSLCASSVYIMNDLIDLARDRAHATKRSRPFASGSLPLSHGLVMAPLFLALAAVLAALVGAQFAAILAVYSVVNVGYSLVIKRKMIIDVVTLACLYGLRLLAGGAATHTPLSEWLVNFAIFIFLSLALVKRCTSSRVSGRPAPAIRPDAAIARRPADAEDAGRHDRHRLHPNLHAVSHSAAVAALYVHPEWLSVIDVVLMYWVRARCSWRIAAR